MKTKRILLFSISFFFSITIAFSQEEENSAVKGSISLYKQKFGLRVGLDLSKIARTTFEEGYSGFEIVGDYRFSKRFYAAAEIGTEERTWNKDNLVTNTKGNYIKLGADFNAYKNWLGMNNAIAVGLRYGFSNFSQELVSYPIFTSNTTFPTNIRTDGTISNGLTASWVEFIIAVKTEIFTNLYLSLNLQLKRMLSQQSPDGFDNLIVPGFNRTYDFSEFGAGYGYTLSYFIPLYKK